MGRHRLATFTNQRNDTAMPSFIMKIRIVFDPFTGVYILLTVTEIQHEGRHRPISYNCFENVISDADMRSFIKEIKNHVFAIADRN